MLSTAFLCSSRKRLSVSSWIPPNKADTIRFTTCSLILSSFIKYISFHSLQANELPEPKQRLQACSKLENSRQIFSCDNLLNLQSIAQRLQRTTNCYKDLLNLQSTAQKLQRTTDDCKDLLNLRSTAQMLQRLRNCREITLQIPQDFCQSARKQNPHVPTRYVRFLLTLTKR